jgi:FKBP-type peptidyl-prolyl cis-trans isomerase (trigger factor)
MRVEVKKLDKLKRTIKVEVQGEELLKEKEGVYSRKSKELKVPGFRPGSAPLKVLEKYHGKFLKEELLKESLPNFYRKALEDNRILPAGMPHVYDIKLTADFLSFSADLETRPEVEVKKSLYRGMKIKDKECAVKEIEIEKVLTNLKDGIKKAINKDLEDGDLAKWASYPGPKSLKEAIKAQLFIEKSRERRQKIDSQVRNHLLKVFKVDLPREEAARHHRELVEREIYDLQRRGVSQDDIDKYKKDLEDKLKTAAEEDLKLFYILEAIAKNEGIKADDNLADVVLGFILSQAEYQG